MSSSSTQESPTTYKARREVRRILEKIGYQIEEEIPLEDVTNNMGEEIWPPYRADMVVTLQYIIEFDTETSKKGKAKGHGTHKRRIHDQWRDRNVRDQIKMKTVRLKSENILKYDEKLTLAEIESQLRAQL